MRRVAIVAATITCLTVPAYSQGMSGNRHQAQDPQAEQHKPKVDEKAYKSALEKMPDKKEPFDPWQNVREKPPSK
jgi:hypothetical protein